MNWFLWLVLICVVWFLFVWPYMKKRQQAVGQVLNPIRKAYIKQTRKMIADYSITEKELFGKEE